MKLKLEQIIIKNQKLIKILLGIFCSFILCYQINITHYSFLYICFSVLLSSFFIYTNLSLSKRERKYTIITSILTAFIMSFGKIIYAYESITYGMDYHVFNMLNTCKVIICFIALYIIFYFVYATIYHKLLNVNIYDKKKTLSNKRVFLYSFFIIFICYFPYFLRCFPALMSPDSFVQIKTVEQVTLTNMHPFIQTWFFGSIYNLGKIIFGPGNNALAFYTITQMAIMSGIFSGVITFMHKHNISKNILIIILLFYALSPLHAFYSVTLWKDIIFSGNFALLIICLFNINEKGLNFKTILFFTLTTLILMFFRNNGIYVFIFMIPFLILFYKEYRKPMIIICIILTAFYFVITGPVYKLIGVGQTKSVEAYSIPLQQIARVLASNEKIDKKSMSYLKNTMNTDKIKVSYTPYIADPVKNLVYFDNFNKSKLEFIKTWFKILTEHPVIYIEAYASSTIGYWYPDVIYHATSFVNCESNLYNAYDYNITNKTKTSKIITRIIDKTNDKTLPFSIAFFSCGLYCFMFIISFIFAIYNRKKCYKFIIGYLPLWGLWVSMMIAAPVFAELRYVYGMFTCMPIILLIPFMRGVKNE